jgi:hypothetical protein
MNNSFVASLSSIFVVVSEEYHPVLLDWRSRFPSSKLARHPSCRTFHFAFLLFCKLLVPQQKGDASPLMLQTIVVSPREWLDCFLSFVIPLSKPQPCSPLSHSRVSSETASKKAFTASGASPFHFLDDDQSVAQLLRAKASKGGD